MPPKGRSNKNRGRSASPLANKNNSDTPNKKPNLTQTEEVPPVASGSNTSVLPETMEVDPPPVVKGKIKSTKLLQLTTLTSLMMSPKIFLMEKTTQFKLLTVPNQTFTHFFP